MEKIDFLFYLSNMCREKLFFLCKMKCLKCCKRGLANNLSHCTRETIGELTH